ncbi:MAG: HlyD family efflux transporter periplasmic adaptor subunit [Chloroflexota bacterium]
MDKRLKILTVIGTILFVSVLGLIGYFSWLNIANVDTLHAQISGPVAQVRAPVAGRLAQMPLQVGDAVAQDEELLVIETGGAALGQAGGSRLMLPVRAPLSGVVAEMMVSEGDALAAGQSLLTVVDPSQVWVTANVHMSRIPQVQVGQRVRILVRARTWRRRYWGRVQQVGAATIGAIAGQTRGAELSTPRLTEVPVRISIDPRGYDLYPGMVAEVRIQLTPRGFWVGP